MKVYALRFYSTDGYTFGSYITVKTFRHKLTAEYVADSLNEKFINNISSDPWSVEEIEICEELECMTAVDSIVNELEKEYKI
jgi:hypothetical protein